MSTMSVMIEVDPKLFITCRLCLKDMGQYQIVPKVREQIKFCFDIEVEPFDGLPQLICKKCEEILSEFYQTKTIYINKQNDLKSQISLKKDISVAQHDRISSCQQDNSQKRIKVFKKTVRKKNRSIISSSSSDISKFSSEKNKNNDSIIDLWDFSYNKQFACRFCKYRNSNQSEILGHVHTYHKQLKEKYNNVFKNHCLVQLSKLDGKPNITGLSSTVVLTSEKIIRNVNLDYFILYSTKEDNYKVSDSSDNVDDNMPVKNKRQRFRLFSKSSNDTVVIPADESPSSFVKTDEQRQKRKDDRENDSEVYECIKIDDSSDTDSEKGNVPVKKIKSHLKSLQKQREIQSIISVCQNNLCKNIGNSNGKIQHKKGSQSANMESHLKHKVLSIGRKIVNKQGFNCTGLLRYMEHKNLDVTWTPKPSINSTTMYTDYIRIMTKLRDNMEDETGWKMVTANEVSQKNKVLYIPISSSAVMTKDVPETNILNTPNEDVIMYNDIGYCPSQCKNKLLNENPVANPKQLPRKGHINETKSNTSKILTTSQKSSNNDLAVCVEMTETNINDNTFVPVITATTSLATWNHDISNCNENTDTDAIRITTNAPFGRIKVKPVSELMSERVLNNMIKEQTSGFINTQDSKIDNIQYQVEVNYVPSAQNNVTPMQIHQVSNTTKQIVTTPNTQKKNADYVILDTVELPNTKTDAPFQYLQNLLQIHNIILLDTKEILGTHYLCLIKFKVKYKQESKDQPVILCLSLFCSKNTFCIKVNDRNQENIDMTKISANWQWEIINIFSGDTVNKLLQNAQKVSKEVYEYTKSFCCLLKSINVSKDT